MKKKPFYFQIIFTLFVTILFFSEKNFAQDTTANQHPLTDSIVVIDSSAAYGTTAVSSAVTHDSAAVSSTPVQDTTPVEKMSAHNHPSIDNGYYTVYPNEFILRIYITSKFAPFTISSSTRQDLNYKTNSKLSFGAGFTYKAVTLNFAYGFKALNPDKGKGATKGLDLQAHIYPRKWAIDIIGAFVRGYYLSPKDNNGLGLTDYYQRPDLHRNIVGLSVFRIASPDRFPFRAAFNQKDWQTKSAGSLLYGVETYYGFLKADSAFVPSGAGSNYLQAGINKLNFFSIGPGIGYAYTLVMSKHFFITASAVASATINASKEVNNGAGKNKVKVIPGGEYKAAFGYNSNTWSVTASLQGNALYAASAASHKEYFLPTGNVNFVVAKKFGAK